MPHRTTALLPALLVCALLFAGCGGDEPAPPAPQPAPAEEKPKTDAEKGGISAAQVKRAISECKRNVQAQGGVLEPDVRKEFEQICEQAASGDEAAVRKATRRVCERTIEESVPAGILRDQAVKSCQQATKAPSP